MSRRVVQGQSGSAKSKIFPRLGGDTGPSGVNDTGRALRASSHDASGVAQAQEEQQRAAERVCGLPVPSCAVGLGKLSSPRSGEGRRDANSPTAPLSQGVQGEGRFDVRGTTRTRKGDEEFSSPETSRSPRNSDSQWVLKFLQKDSVHRLCALSVGLLFPASRSVPCFCFCGDNEELLTAIQGGVVESCNVDGKRGLRCTSLREWLAGFWFFGTPVTTRELVYVQVGQCYFQRTNSP